MKKKIGRSTKYNDDIRKKLCDLARQGNCFRNCAAKCGINESTLYDWFNEFPEFSKAMHAAEAEAAIERTQRIRAAGVRVRKDESGNPFVEGDWHADAWWLERRMRDEYCLRIEHDHRHSIDEGLQNARKLVDAIYEAATRDCAKDERRARRVSRKKRR